MADERPVVVFAPDLLMRRQIVDGLSRAGIPVRGAATRARFEAALAEGAAGLVLELDGVGIDGLALVASLRTASATADVPLLGVCAHTRVELITGARAAGATRVVSRGELVRRLPQLAAELFTANPRL